MRINKWRLEGGTGRGIEDMAGDGRGGKDEGIKSDQADRPTRIYDVDGQGFWRKEGSPRNRVPTWDLQLAGMPKH
jgi:hypothetical protein